MTADTTITIKDYMDRQFARVEEALKDIKAQLVGRDNFAAACAKITDLQDVSRDHDRRLQKTERAIWLLSIIAGILIPVLGALIGAWLTGNILVTFK